MSKSIQLYPFLSFLTFYMIQISSKTVFAVFGIFLYIAAGIALLAYLESTERTKKSDIISIIIYILFTAVFFLLPLSTLKQKRKTAFLSFPIHAKMKLWKMKPANGPMNIPG